MQSNLTNLHKELLVAGVHLGHQKKKWNPKMLPYIYSESAGIHLIDINKTASCLDKAAAVLKQVAKSGKKILFVATKKQAKNIVKGIAEELEVHYVTERWLGGMLTNFVTIRRSVKKMQQIEKTLADNEVNTLTKKEKLTMDRDKQKIGKVLGGVSTLNTIPGCVFLVDIQHEHIALAEAKKLGITTVGIVDTNSNPELIDFPIPANDDSTKSISLIVKYLAVAIQEGLEEHKKVKQKKELDEANATATEETSKKEIVAKEASSPDEEIKKTATITKRKKRTPVTQQSKKLPTKKIAASKKEDQKEIPFSAKKEEELSKAKAEKKPIKE